MRSSFVASTAPPPPPPPPPPLHGRHHPPATRGARVGAAAAAAARPHPGDLRAFERFSAAVAIATTTVSGVATTMTSSVAPARAWPRRPRSARRGFRGRHGGPTSTRGARSARRTAAAAGKARRRLRPLRGAVVASSEPPPPSVARPQPRPTRGARRPHILVASAPRRLARGRPLARGGGRSVARAIMVGVSPQWPVLGGPTRPTEGATGGAARPAGPGGALGESPRQGAVGLVYYSARAPHFRRRRSMGPSLTS